MPRGSSRQCRPLVVSRNIVAEVKNFSHGAEYNLPGVWRRFDVAHDHYLRAFDPEVRESKRDIRAYINDTAKGEYSENGKDGFVYQGVWLLEGRRESSMKFLAACTGDVLSPIDIKTPKGAMLARAPSKKYGMASGAYVWTAKSQFAQGFAKAAVLEAIKSAEAHAQEQGFAVKLTFAEFEPEQQRLGALEAVTQMAVPIVLSGVKTMRAYYEQPGLEKGARSVPLIMGFGFAAWGGIVPSYKAQNGIQVLTVTRMPTDVLVYGALRQMESYRTADYANQRQISRISQGIVESLNPAKNKFTLMVPLADAASLPMDPARS